MKFKGNNKLFTPMDFINGKTYHYGRKGVLGNFHYRDDTKLGPGVVAIRRITCSFNSSTK